MARDLHESAVAALLAAASEDRAGEGGLGKRVPRPSGYGEGTVGVIIGAEPVNTAVVAVVVPLRMFFRV